MTISNFHLTASVRLCLVSLLCITPLNSHAQLDLKTAINAEMIRKSIADVKSSAAAAKTLATESKIGRFLKPLTIKQKGSSPKSTPFMHIKGGQLVQVYISIDKKSENAIDEITQLGADVEVHNTELNKVQAWIPYSQLTALAELSSISKITVPNYGEPAKGRVTTQGDAILRANLLRDLGGTGKGATGRGVKVGVVSDGANDWRSAAQTGDLPNNVTTYGNCARRSADPQNCRSALTCNEGTAMAEIIHDIAPEAELAVAAVSTSLEFIQQINRLAGTFGADIIVDDLGFFGEPYFEDGDLARAVSRLPSNVLYFSSAGNSGNTHYERQYSTFNTSQHNFGVQNGTNDDAIGFIVRPNRGTFVLLQWSDRYETPNSDYDLFVFDQNTEVGRSAGRTSTAIEGVCVFNGSNTDAVRFAVVDKAAGSNRRLEMFFLGAGAIEYSIPAGSVFGHAGTPRAIAVGAINAGSSSPAFYSSRGPAVIDYPSVQQRFKPDISATDGVSVTGAGGFSSPFFGTSAAAPHAAAVAALLLSTSDKLTPLQVRNAIFNNASGGTSSALGRGQINALAAFESLGIDITTIGRGRNKVFVGPLFLLLDDDD